MTSRRWSNVTKIIVTATLVVLVIVLVVTFRAMISPTIVAFLLAFILSHPVNWIQRQTGWARGACVAVLYIALLGVLALMPALFIQRAMGLFVSLQQTLEDLVTSLRSAQGGPLFTFGNYHLSADNLLQRISDVLQNLLILATADPLTLFRGVTTGILTLVYVLVLNFWLLKDVNKLKKLIFEQIPGDYQEDVHRLAQELGKVWNAFLRGQLVLSLVVGSIVWIAMMILGMPNAAGLALLAAVMEFLPHIGTGFSTTIGTAVALFQGSTWIPLSPISFALIVLIVYVVIAQMEHVYLIPRLVGGRVKLHPAITFIGIINGAIAFGVLGVLLATPVIASARLIASYIRRKLLDLEPFEPLPSATGVRIRGLIAGRKIEALIFDLDGTLTLLDMQFTVWVVKYFDWLNRIVSVDQRRYIAQRLMVSLEGIINFVISQLLRLELRHDLKRMLPLLNRLRGEAAPAAMTVQPGFVDSLHELSLRYRLGLISTRDKQTVHCLLTKAGLNDHLFEVILTCEDVHHLLPHSEALRLAATQFNLEPNQLLIISDTDTNLRAGRAMEMATAGILCGLGNAEDMRDADLVLATVPAMLEWL
jgi:predicted PurR-regulated permease PerM/beta-phosphoglucomutase-like phosphatase (HAD superfamily)